MNLQHLISARIDNTGNNFYRKQLAEKRFQPIIDLSMPPFYRSQNLKSGSTSIAQANLAIRDLLKI
jgi:hypothetical protein